MNKVLSCVLCFLPGVLFAIALVLMGICSMETGGTMDGSVGAIFIILMLLTAFLSVIAVYGVMIWLIIKTFKNSNITTGVKVVWTILLYSFNMLVFSIYWFVYIRNE